MNLKNNYLQFLVNDQLIAYRATGENIHPVPTSSQTGSLPKHTILKQGGILHLYGHNFDLSKNGLYRFIINKNIMDKRMQGVYKANPNENIVYCCYEELKFRVYENEEQNLKRTL